MGDREDRSSGIGNAVLTLINTLNVMNFRWQDLKAFPRLLSVQAPDLVQQKSRIRFMEVNIALPVKGLLIGMLVYYLFSGWADFPFQRGETVWAGVRFLFLLYVAATAGTAWMLMEWRPLSFDWLQRIAFHSAWIDALFLSVLTFVTGGFDSVLFWGFLALIIRNAVNNPVARKQLSLNGIVIAGYLTSGLLGSFFYPWQLESAGVPPFSATELAVLRIALLVLATFCSFGVQVLVDRQRSAEAEAREFAMRQQQLQAQGRLAAEIAHQLKNPLGIINNAAFTLQRTVREGKTITQQIQIIREEVDRSDRIITELMGYARLSEGTVEKIDVAEELDQAIDRVFPRGAEYEVKIHRDYGAALPALLVQRSHLSEAFVNILQNAREAMDGKGNIWIKTRYADNYSVLIAISDDGPGIPPDKLTKVFEPYFTTKEKGTGLGLAIVKHNTEIYGGTVSVESELGQGACFTINLPAKTVMKIRR